MIKDILERFESDLYKDFTRECKCYGLKSNQMINIYERKSKKDGNIYDTTVTDLIYAHVYIAKCMFKFTYKDTTPYLDTVGHECDLEMAYKFNSYDIETYRNIQTDLLNLINYMSINEIDKVKDLKDFN